jgi:hypothetical protein
MFGCILAFQPLFVLAPGYGTRHLQGPSIFVRLSHPGSFL